MCMLVNELVDINSSNTSGLQNGATEVHLGGMLIGHPL